jgi:hypothetical protein
MSKETNMPMTKAELLGNMAFFGPAPVLTTENVKDFEELFLQFAKCFKVQDLVMMDLTWHYTANSWFSRRFLLHSTTAIERWYGNNRKTEMLNAQLKKDQYERQLQAKAQQISRTPADVAEMAALEKKIANTVTDIDRIFARKETEIDHSRALQITAEFQESLDRLNNSATRRRDDAYNLLERYSKGLGRAVQEKFDKILDAEFEEIENEKTETENKTEAEPESKIETEPETKAEPETKIEDQTVIITAPSIITTGDEA